MTTLLEIRTEPRHGFFSAFFGVLRGIREAEQHGYIPKVTWDQNSPYHSQKDGENAWLNFFDQVSPEVPKSVVGRVIVRNFVGWEGISCYPGQGILETLTTLYHKYIRLNNQVKMAIPVLPEGTVGVHYRGTDKVHTKENAAPPIEALIQILKANSVYSSKPFFFATDDIDALTAMKKEFPSVLYNSCIRSSGTSVHNHYNYINEIHTPTKDGPLKGRQVLVDALTMSQCSHIMRCPSGVSLFSIVASTNRQTWMDYTSHTWENFLLSSPRNIQYYDVLNINYVTEVDDVLWISNKHKPTQLQLASLKNKRQLYVIDNYHELVSAKAIFDDECIEFAVSLLRNTMPNHFDNFRNQPVVSSVDDFTIVCSKSMWQELRTNTLEPLYSGKILYNEKKASMPLQSLPRFALLILSMCTRDIGMLTSF